MAEKADTLGPGLRNVCRILIDASHEEVCSIHRRRSHGELRASKGPVFKGRLLMVSVVHMAVAPKFGETMFVCPSSHRQ